MKKIIWGLCGLALSSCTTSKMNPPREPSSDVTPLSMVSPLTDQTFWEEYQAAKPGFDKDDIKNSKYRNGVFYRWIKANPIGLFRDLRQKSPVLYLDGDRRGRNPQYVVLSAAADVEHVLKERNNYVLAKDYDSYVVSTASGPQTGVTSRWFSQLFNRDTKWVQEAARQLVQKSLEEGIYIGENEKGQRFARIEYVSQLGRKVPFLLNEQVYGLTGFEMQEATDISRSLADDLLLNPANEAEIDERAQKAYEILQMYVKNLLDGHIRAPQGTILANLQQEFLQSGGNSSKISREEFQTLTRYVAGLFSGVETSQTTVARALDQLMRHGQLEKAQDLARRNDDWGLRRMMYEALRFDPVAPYAIRKVAVQTQLPSGVVLQPGTILIVGTQSAMFDENRVPDPYRFIADRSFKDFLHYRRSGMAQVRDQVTEIESFEVLKALLKNPGLRRAEGHFGEIDERRPITAKLLKKDRFRVSFPERWDLEFDTNRTPRGVEISDKAYPYEDYLLDYDRISFRLCLGGLKRSLATVDDGNGDSFWKNMREIGRILGHSRTIAGNISVSKMNRTKENKHLLYCRMPEAYRQCVESKKFSIQKVEDKEVHRSQYLSCYQKMTNLEQKFYENVFFDKPLDLTQLTQTQGKRPQDPFYTYEDYLKFYDRYRARESMMNPAGYVMNDQQMVFYVRLNIDFRMCLGGPVLANKYTGGRLGKPKAEQFEKCKDGYINPDTFRREGALTEFEKSLYEKIML